MNSTLQLTYIKTNWFITHVLTIHLCCFKMKLKNANVKQTWTPMLDKKRNMFSKTEKDQNCLLASLTIHVDVIHLQTANTLIIIINTKQTASVSLCHCLFIHKYNLKSLFKAYRTVLISVSLTLSLAPAHTDRPPTSG